MIAPSGGPAPVAAPFAATALVAFRGFFRDRALAVALVLVFFALGLGRLLADASLGHAGRLDADLAWAAAELMGWFLALIHGSGWEGRRGVLGPFAFARPVSAGLLLGGRFLGLAAGLAVYAAGVTFVLLGWLAAAHGEPPLAILASGWLFALRLGVILAVATLLLALTRPEAAAPLGAVCCMTGWFVGALAPPGLPAALRPLTALAELLLPNMPGLEEPLAGWPARFAEVPPLLLPPTVWAVLYATGLLAAAMLVFPRRVRRPGGLLQ